MVKDKVDARVYRIMQEIAEKENLSINEVYIICHSQFGFAKVCAAVGTRKSPDTFLTINFKYLGKLVPNKTKMKKYNLKFYGKEDIGEGQSV